MDSTRLAVLKEAARAVSGDAYVDDDGALRFGTTVYLPKWEGEEGSADLSSLRQALERSGLVPGNFDLLQLAVRLPVPHQSEGGAGELGPGSFPDQLAVIDKIGRYRGLHQLDLVLANPYITVTEIKNGIAAGTSGGGV